MQCEENYVNKFLSRPSNLLTQVGNMVRVQPYK